MGKKDKLKDITNAHIEVCLEQAGSGQGAAALLGVSKNAFYEMLKRRGKKLGPTLRPL